MVSETFASVLRSGRAEFNSRFAEARRLHPDLDGAAFSGFLETTVDKLVRAAEPLGADRVADMVLAAYDAGLELVAQKLVGPGARHPWIEAGWERVLPAMISLVADSPGRVMAAISNALQHLASPPGARPEQWISDMEKLGAQCKDVDTLLRVGQVAAWKAGLAHFRQGALGAADLLPVPLALAVVGAPEAAPWPKIRERLASDPWFDPAGAAANGAPQVNQVRVMTQAGTFRGFGGLFVEPPLVAGAGEHFFVRSGEECWILTADLFGATFHRTSLADFDSAREHGRLPPELHVKDSRLVWKGEKFEIAALGKFTSAAANGRTLALTSAFTHAVTLVALG